MYRCQKQKTANGLFNQSKRAHKCEIFATRFKSCIFEQLDCTSEVEFLFKVLTNLQHILTPQSSMIKNKAIEIAESQYINEYTTTAK